MIEARACEIATGELEIAHQNTRRKSHLTSKGSRRCLRFPIPFGGDLRYIIFCVRSFLQFIYNSTSGYLLPEDAKDLYSA